MYAMTIPLELEGLLTEVLDSCLERRWILKLDGDCESEQVVDSHSEPYEVSLVLAFVWLQIVLIVYLNHICREHMYVTSLSPVIIYTRYPLDRQAGSI